ncbi:hypothetical protein Rhe02_09330 [Rhizocola hellebori]|uniref:Nephrocystin 3-like N-terminal domain-containing protein n=2 Tax=Rhizocola hellebori TaxID=1392758 RepID=A0A8J3Q3A5_9ACTN|nr:hypothetical protein Rhe02_09330 [Rhizocola hellebori]
MGREAELDELAGFCAGTEAYLWWQAEPWAGKSALMSSFVLNPPAGVDVLSFFVTARLVSQADSNAFTDALLEQLAAMHGEQLPALLTASARDSHRRALLKAVVARAREAGRRVVLVVDGLDEDAGTRAGSGLPSIASLLPKLPEEGLRIVLAGRPHPPIPLDVAHDHPLRDCRVRRLEAWPHAQAVRQRAQLELDELLVGDEVSLEVIGFVAACGGGLTLPELQELTGRPRFLLDGLLHGVFGRTIVGREENTLEAPSRLFLFAHESLRVEAIERLRGEILNSFMNRINTWADGYRQKGWPSDTGQYLLRGYSRMLHSQHDVGRLTALAVDAARHDRLLGVTGGDSTAMVEIRAAQELMMNQSSIDLLTIVRLAVRRDDLLARNLNVPTNLPATWVYLGQPVRAESLARLIANPERQAKALTLAIIALVLTGELDRARAITDSIIDPQQKAHAEAALRLPQRAEKVLAHLEYVMRSLYGRSRLNPDIPILIAQIEESNDISTAVRLARECEKLTDSIEEPRRRAWMLAELARAVAVAGDPGEGERLAAATEAVARTATDFEEEASAWMGLIEPAALDGDLETIQAVGNVAYARALLVDDEQRRSTLLGGIAEAYTKANLIQRAKDTISAITSPRARYVALTSLGRTLISRGQGTAVQAILDQFLTPEERAFAAAVFAEAFAESGDRVSATELTHLSESLIEAGASPERRFSTWLLLAKTRLDLGDESGALNLARAAKAMLARIADPERRLASLVGLMELYAKAGKHESASAIADLAYDLSRDPLVLELHVADLIESMAASGLQKRAEVMAAASSRYGNLLFQLALIRGLLAQSLVDQALEVVLKSGRPSVDALNLVIVAATRQGRPETAENALEAALHLSQGLPMAEREATQVSIVEALAAVEMFEDASRVVATMRRSNARVEASALLVTRLAHQGKISAAKRGLLDIVADAAELGGEALVHLAEPLALVGDTDLALWWKQSIDASGNSPRLAEARATVAIRLAELGEHREALNLANNEPHLERRARALLKIAMAAPDATHIASQALIGCHWTVSLSSLRTISPDLVRIIARERLEAA